MLPRWGTNKSSGWTSLLQWPPGLCWLVSWHLSICFIYLLFYFLKKCLNTSQPSAPAFHPGEQPWCQCHVTASFISKLRPLAAQSRTLAPTPCSPAGDFSAHIFSVFILNGWLPPLIPSPACLPPPHKTSPCGPFLPAPSPWTIFSQASHDTEIPILLLRLFVLSFRNAGVSLLISLGLSPWR